MKISFWLNAERKLKKPLVQSDLIFIFGEEVERKTEKTADAESGQF